MKRLFNIIIILLVPILTLFLVTGCNKVEDDKLTIISTSFPGYDAAKNIVGDSSDIEISMLLKPGEEIHNFEPTPKDIINIKKSDILIIVGGESDNWIEEIINNIDLNKTKVIKLIDLTDTKDEEIVEGMETKEQEQEVDEHVWTSPINMIKIVESVKEDIIKIDSNNKEIYEKNTNNYIRKIKEIDREIREVTSSGKRNEIIFGDRFPIRYFADEYNLNYYAAFPGCSEQTEPSAKTISFLINKIKEDNIPIVFHLELTEGKIAKTIADETNTKALVFHSAHNVSQDDFNNGITYVDIMKKNIEVLKEALN